MKKHKKIGKIKRSSERNTAKATPSLSTGAPARKMEKYCLLAIIGAALVLRLIYFLLNKHNDPLFYQPIMDSLYHHEWAKSIISGDFWGHEVFFRAPLYPYFLAFLYKLSGSSIAFAKLFQHLIGVASVALIYFLSRVYFKTGVSLLAALLAALYWPMIYFEDQLLIVTLFIFLNLLFLLTLSSAIKRDSRKFLFISGIILGFSAVSRPNILIFVLALPVIFYCSRASDSVGASGARGVWNRWGRRTAVVIAGAALIISPVIIRNYVVGRDIVPIASQGGVNFYIGNNSQSDGRTAIVPGTRPDWWGGYYDTINMAEKSAGKKLRPSQVSHYFFRKGFDFIASNPRSALGLFLHKFRMFWSGGERANNKNIYFFWRLSGMGSAPLVGFWLVCPFALLGGVLLWRKRVVLSVLYLFVVLYSVGVITFFVNARFRLPVVPILIIFASYAIHYLIDSYRSRSASFVKALLLLVVFATAVNADFASFKENKVYADSFSHYTLGNAYLKMGKKDLALKEYEKAYENQKRYPVSAYTLIARNIDNNLGTMYWKQGLCKKAIEHLRMVGGRDEYAAVAKRNLAECYVQEGMFDDAVRSYREVLSINPTDRISIMGLANLYIKLGAKDQARELLQRAKALYPEDESLDEILQKLSER